MYRVLPLVVFICLWFGPEGSAQPAPPGLVINEFLPNQTGGLETEWIELYNGSHLTVDLNLFRIGDAIGFREISDTTLYLPSGEYIVLAQDIARFRQFYKNYSGRLASPVGWQVLNNDGDMVRLAEHFGSTIDSVVYDKGFPDNRSWERYTASDGTVYWGESFAASGSTPGAPNSFFYPRISTIDLGASPDPFSPDGDGRDDVTVISYNPPEADGFDLAIYDISGTKVKTFFDKGISIPGEVAWDGRADDGRILPIGIYIIYAHVEGGKTYDTKRTVVIAR